jgi:hypothetical protein
VHYEALDVYEQHSSTILGIIQIPNPAYATTIATASQTALQAAIAHHGIMPNNPNPVPTLVNFSPQQLISLPQTFLPPSMHQLLMIQWENSFKFLSYNLWLKVLKFFCSSPPFINKRMKPSKCCIGGFSSLKRILRASQT